MAKAAAKIGARVETEPSIRPASPGCTKVSTNWRCDFNEGKDPNGVPVVFVSGDDAAVEETRRLLGDVEGAVVKRAISFHSATTMTPKAAQQLIRERVKAALARRSAFKPYVVRPPIALDVVFKNYRPAEILAYLPIVQRTTAHAIRFTGKDMVEVSRFLEFIGTYEPGISP